MKRRTAKKVLARQAREIAKNTYGWRTLKRVNEAANLLDVSFCVDVDKHVYIVVHGVDEAVVLRNNVRRKYSWINKNKSHEKERLRRIGYVV